MTATLFGIPNCGTVKKARTWLEARKIPYHFHDYKKSGVTTQRLQRWCDALGWEAVLNRTGTTFRKLADDKKANLDAARSIELMHAQPSMIRRPMVEHCGGLLVGFREDEWERALGG